MRRNLTERGTAMGSERLLAGLAARVGKQSAQAELQRLLHDDTGVTRSLSEPALVAEISAHVRGARVRDRELVGRRCVRSGHHDGR